MQDLFQFLSRIGSESRASKISVQSLVLFWVLRTRTATALALACIYVELSSLKRELIRSPLLWDEKLRSPSRAAHIHLSLHVDRRSHGLRRGITEIFAELSLAN